MDTHAYIYINHFENRTLKTDKSWKLQKRIPHSSSGLQKYNYKSLFELKQINIYYSTLGRHYSNSLIFGEPGYHRYLEP